MIGISIEIPNSSDRYLYKVLNGIDICNYTWFISYDEVLYNENNIDKNSLFEFEIMDGTKVLERISLEEYYLIFVDM